MNEVIEKCYKDEIETDSNRLFNNKIDRKWCEILDLITPVTDIPTQNDISSLIGDVWAESTEIGFKAGFRAAIKFFMNFKAVTILHNNYSTQA